MTTFPSNLLADGLIGTRDLALLFAFSSGGRRQSEVASAVIGRTVGTRARKAPGVTVALSSPKVLRIEAFSESTLDRRQEIKRILVSATSAPMRGQADRRA
jgi:hypothetical protein